MIRDLGRPERRPWGDAVTPTPSKTTTTTNTPTKRRPSTARRPTVEPLEGRQLLSQFFSGATANRPVQTLGSIYTLSVSGPGLVKVQRLGHGVLGVKLFGTTVDSTLNVSLRKQRLHQPATPLEIGSINVVSGTIGGINAGAAELLGAVTPLSGVSTINFGSLGQNAGIDVNGSLATLGLGSVDLGPNGHVNIKGGLGQSLNVGGPFILDGGQFTIGGDVAGALSLGSLQVSRGGRFVVSHNVTGATHVSGDLRVNDNGLVAVGQNLNGLTVGGKLALDTGGRLVVGNDVRGSVNVAEDFAISNKASFSVGRDVTLSGAGLIGGITVGGNLSLASGGTIVVGRDLNAVTATGSTSTSTNQASLTVIGNLTVDPSGGSITVGGNFNTFQVDGIFRGKGTTVPDLSVGLDLRNTTVLGGSPNAGGIAQASIDVGKNIINLNVSHGIFNSFITAGVLIDNVNVGPDGADALSNSDIRAGVEINHTTFNGNVRSTFATDPKSPGYPTRIVAGEDRAGNFTSGALIDNFQILGTMFDSVVAASVAPYGGNGTLPVSPYGAPPPTVGPPPGDLGFNTYDAPFGTTTVTVGSTTTSYNNYTERSYKEGIPLAGTFYDMGLDNTIDDSILFGSINPTFASAGGLPVKSTVLGGVVSTPHGDNADYAGLFAYDTRGVFVGRLPGT